MIKGLQWKIVLVYSLLLLFALQLIGLYLVQSLEQYYMKNYKSGLRNQAQLLSEFLVPYMTIEHDSSEDIGNLVRGFRGLREIEITVLDSNAHVITTSGNQEMVGSRLIRDEITRALTGSDSDAIRFDSLNQERRYYLAYPVEYDGIIPGIVYLSGSLMTVDETLNEVKMIILTGAALALVISVFLGIVLTRTITVPIQAVTNTANLMAQGDFSKRIDVQTADELGQLGRAFNYLAERQSQHVKQIYSEKSKVEAIINYMTDGVVALDGEGLVMHVNPAAQDILSLLSQPLLFPGSSGKPMLEKLLGKTALSSFWEHKRSLNVEIVHERPALVLQVRVAPFQEAAESQEGILIVIHDITKERELVKRQQEFVADVSHELRTPLTTVKSYVETLLDGAAAEPEVCRKFLEVVDKEADRMVALVKDLLVLSQLDYSQVVWNKTEVYLNQLVVEVIEHLRQKFALRTPEMVVDIPDQASRVFVDRDKIMQVLLNILNNAIKFTPEEGIIHIAAKPAGKRVKVVVTDNGAGIPAEDLPRVFERFYRVEKTRSRDYGGTGLGLSIAKRIVEAHDGEINIESTVGEGTRVIFTLPRAI